MIELGLIVKDKITGLVGVAENRASFIYGCDRYFIQPQIDKDGKIPKGMMIDEPQLEILIDKDQVMKPLAEPMQTVEFGREVHDPIIDRKGTATGRAVYINGCSRIYVEPKHSLLTTDTKGWWADEKQLTMRKKVVHKTEPESRKFGGEARSSSKY